MSTLSPLHTPESSSSLASSTQASAAPSVPSAVATPVCTGFLSRLRAQWVRGFWMHAHLMAEMARANTPPRF